MLVRCFHSFGVGNPFSPCGRRFVRTDLGYDSALWTNNELYNRNGNVKTAAFFEPFSAIKLEICEITGDSLSR